MPSVIGPAPLIAAWEDLSKRVNAIAPPARDIARAGLRKVVDYQDIAYGAEYLDHLFAWQAKDDEHHEFKLTQTAAKYIANAMCYDDITRVADLKTRASRNTGCAPNRGFPKMKSRKLPSIFIPAGKKSAPPYLPDWALGFLPDPKPLPASIGWSIAGGEFAPTVCGDTSCCA